MIAELPGQGAENAGPDILHVREERLRSARKGSRGRGAGDGVVQPLEAERGGVIDLDLALHIGGLHPDPVRILLIELVTVVIALRDDFSLCLDAGTKEGGKDKGLA